MKKSAALAVAVTVIAASSAAASAAGGAWLAPLKTLAGAGTTVPANGDVNPYGIVRLQTSVGALKAGDLLVCELQRQGQQPGDRHDDRRADARPGKPSVFATINGGVAARQLPGRRRADDGAGHPAGRIRRRRQPADDQRQVGDGEVRLPDRARHSGHAVQTISGPTIQGPWDMTAVTHGDASTLFVSNVLNGGAGQGKHAVKNSTVVRINAHLEFPAAPKVISEQVIATGFPWRDDPAALVIGPTGARAGEQRHAVRRGHARQPDRSRSPTRCTRTTAGRRQRDARHDRRSPEPAARAGACAERRHPHDQRRQRRASSRRRRPASRSHGSTPRTAPERCSASPSRRPASTWSMTGTTRCSSCVDAARLTARQRTPATNPGASRCAAWPAPGTTTHRPRGIAAAIWAAIPRNF